MTTAVKPIPDGYPVVTPYLIVDGAAAGWCGCMRTTTPA